MRIIVTAGPTREFMDPVRFISNRSSGKMGYALAGAAAARGHKVLLVSGPCALSAPRKTDIERVVTAEQMLEAVREALPKFDALVMAAAVCDWRPKHKAPQKIKKTAAPRMLELKPAPDILKTVAPLKHGKFFVGFAAETEDIERNARRKLREKRLDLIVANDVSRADSGFDSDTNLATLLDADGGRNRLPLMSKDKLALRIVRWLEKKASGRGAGI